MNKLVCCLHTHFMNLHFDGCSAYWLETCTHLSNFVISMKTLSIILIQAILTKNYCINGRLRMNRSWIFGNASLTCNFKLRGARWNFPIFGTGSNISLRNLPVPRRSLKSILDQHSSMRELRNYMWMQSLSRLTVHLPLIQ